MRFRGIWILVLGFVSGKDLQGNYEIPDIVFGCDNHYYRQMEKHVRNSNLHKIPQNIEIAPLNVTFYLNTRHNPNSSQLLVTGDVESLKKSYFNSSIPTRIITHGFCNCRHSDFCLVTRDMFLYRQEYNVITTNWQSGRQVYDYWIARKRIIPASEQLAKFIDFLHNDGGMALKDLYLVGHSLGAHLSGLAGKAVSSGKVSTIVALDPALPMFDVKTPSERLASTDAEYVEVIHTNGGKLGLFDPIGHTDFYPNGGVKQPGCYFWWFGSSCSHRRAWELYAESIVSKVGFWSSQCDSVKQVSPGGCRSSKEKLRMGGEPIVQRSRGILTVQTRDEAPYAEGKLDKAYVKKWSNFSKKKTNKKLNEAGLVKYRQVPVVTHNRDRIVRIGKIETRGLWEFS